MTQEESDQYDWMNGQVRVRLEVENYKGNRQRVISQQVVAEEMLPLVGLEEVVDDLVRQILRKLRG